MCFPKNSSCFPPSPQKMITDNNNQDQQEKTENIQVLKREENKSWRWNEVSLGLKKDCNFRKEVELRIIIDS